MGASQVRVLLTGDRLDVDWPAQAGWTGLVAGCRMRDGTIHESAAWSAVAGAEGRYRARCGPLDVDLALHPADGGLRVQVAATAIADVDVDVAEVGVSGRAAGHGSDLAWVLVDGYQSWDASGYQPAGDSPRESWWTVAVADGRGAGLVAAAEDALSSCTRFEVAGATLAVTWRETVTLEQRPSLFSGPAGTAWRSGGVLMAAGPDVRASLRSLLGVTARPAPPTVGWLSWYHYGPWVSRDEVLTHADMLAGGQFRELGYRLVQVDDGWQEAIGEWRPNTKFPGGLAALSADFARRGHTAGLWLAPFLVSVAADLARDAPDDWFVLDPDTGERAVDPQHRVFGPLHVLDASRPGVQEHLRQLFAGLYDEGIRYFKIDFLYAGAYAGLQALRAGMEAIRAGARDAVLVASGAPLLPMAGVVEVCRVGPDTATPLTDFETGVSTPTVFGDEVMAVARNVAARTMLDCWFTLDADVALVGGNLTLEQGRQLVTVAALSGGPFIASDDLGRLPRERLELLTNPEILALAGGPPALPDWEPNQASLPPTHWRRGDVLAVFNWAAERVTVPVRAPGAAGARDIWAGHDLPDLVDGTPIDVPPHGVRVLRIR